MGGYVTLDYCIVGWCGSGEGRSFWDLFCVLDTLLALVVDGGVAGIPSVCCLVSSLDSRLLS